MKKSKIITVIAMLLFILLLFVIANMLKDLNTTTIEEHSFYQYFIGKKFNYDGGLKLTRKKDITELTFKDIQVDLDSTPVYYADIENKVLLPEDMAIVFPMQSGLMYKINHFSNVFFDTDTVYLETKTGNDRALNNAFLYDGQDLYFFLENTTLKVGETQYEISPLSYVICQNKGNVEIYQKDKDIYTIVENNKEEVKAKNNNYEIDLIIDSIEQAGEQQLLIKNKSNLKNY